MRAFDEAYVDGSELFRGGNQKQIFFTTDVLSRLQFSGCPELDALVEELVGFFQVRYEKPPDAAYFEALKKAEAMIENFPDGDLILVRNTSSRYEYQNRMNQLKA